MYLRSKPIMSNQEAAQPPKRKVTRLPPEAPRPCFYCGAPVLLRLQSPGFRSKWTRDNQDGTRHDCPRAYPQRPRIRETQAEYLVHST